VLLSVFSKQFFFLPILVFVPRFLSAHRFGYPQVLTLLS
jgi:hypothetical protein